MRQELTSYTKKSSLILYDYESLEIYESYLMGKITKTLFTGHGERTSELLRLMQIDVCGAKQLRPEVDTLISLHLLIIYQGSDMYIL